MLRKTLIINILAIIPTLILAQKQEAIVTGYVQTADGKPAASVTVGLKNTSYGTVTDANGEFKFHALEGEYTMSVFSIMAHLQEFAVMLRADTVNHFPDIMIRENIKQLEDIVVTGTRTEKRLSETPVLTTLIRDREIREAASVSVMESLLDNIPGIVSEPNAMGNNLRIRGLSSRYILFLVDGERLVAEGAGGNVNLDQIDVDNIRRIEMVNGASSTLYGSNAVGSVINIITKEPAHKLELGVSQLWEYPKTLKSRIDIGSSFKKFLVKGSAFRNSSDGFGGEGVGVFAARYEDYGAELKLGYKPTKKSDANLIGRYFRHETFNPENSMNVSHSLTQNVTIGGNGSYAFADGKNSIRASLNFDKYFDYYVLEKRNKALDLRNTASYISARVVHTFIPTKKWEVVIGTEYNHEENFAKTTMGSQPVTKGVDDINGFAQTQYKPLRSFDIVGGLRYTYNSQFGNALTPALSLMYGIKGFKFRTNFGMAFRAPSIKELYYDFDHQGMFWIYGNPDLKAEKGVYASVSAEYARSNFNISVSGYYNRIGNKITQYDIINEEGKNEKHYTNVNSATIAGLDLSASYTLLKQLTFKASYSYCEAIDNATGLQLESNTKHSGTGSITWNGKIAKSPFSLQFSGRIHSPKLYQQIVTDANGVQQTELAQSKIYSIWKVSIVKPFLVKKHKFEITFKVDNIFNFREASFINPGRTYLVGFRYNFKYQ